MYIKYTLIEKKICTFLIKQYHLKFRSTLQKDNSYAANYGSNFFISHSVYNGVRMLERFHVRLITGKIIMKLISFIQSYFQFVTLVILSLFSLSSICYANSVTDQMSNARQKMGTYTLDTPHLYVGANIGLSHLRDQPNSGSANTVKENGPGGSVVAGYQINSMWGAELGFTQYYNSKETNNGTIIAKTEHYAIPLALTGRYPLIGPLSALGKAGVEYNYAQKMAILSGVAKSSNVIGFYWGLGFIYSVTTKADVVAQFAQAAGSHATGSTDLWSIGINFAVV